MRRLHALARRLLGLLLIAMVVLNVANAAGRYLLGVAIPGSDELMVFAMVWVVFVGALLVTVDDGHLGFDLLSRTLPPGGARALHVLKNLTVALLSGYVAIQSWAVLQKLERVGQRSMATEIPMTIPHAAVFVGLGLTCVAALWLALRRPGAAQASGRDGAERA